MAIPASVGEVPSEDWEEEMSVEAERPGDDKSDGMLESWCAEESPAWVGDCGLAAGASGVLESWGRGGPLTWVGD